MKNRVHFLNVGEGDCMIIEHAGGNVTMIDICGGNIAAKDILTEAIDKMGREKMIKTASISGNFQMSEYPTNPIRYLETSGIGKSIFRFILTHPDMDHMDGIQKLFKDADVSNFWDSGVRREEDPSKYELWKWSSDDWDEYQAIISSRENYQGSKIMRVNAQPGGFPRFSQATSDDQGGYGDGLFVLAPTKIHAEKTDNWTDGHNDASYVIVHKLGNKTIVFAGDSHDGTWNDILNDPKRKKLVENCSVLIAPHHGRDSDRDYAFLDTLQPELNLLGIAPSKHLAYGKYKDDGSMLITNNQAGNVILALAGDDPDALFVFVENQAFAQKWRDYYCKENEDPEVIRELFGGYLIGCVGSLVPVNK